MEPFFWTAAKSWLADRWSKLYVTSGTGSSPSETSGRTGAECDPGLETSALGKADSELSLVLEAENPFSALPDELLALILRKCEPEAFLSAWQVGRRWHAVASQEAAPLFNAKPRQGIAFLMQNEVFHEESAVARFLLKGADLNRGLIGDYLGDRTPRCDKILQAYLEPFDFAGLDIEDALELFDGGFVMPNLPHKRLRILRRFGERYLRCNPGLRSASEPGGGLRVEFTPTMAADLAMCLLDLRASVVDRSLFELKAHVSESRERFLKWAYVQLPAPILGEIHDQTVAKLAVRKT
ncbi:hypothetical protein KFL_000190140 [Klebsormidium nitens]|uniref:F-box domain-containing protein n=1 Tax=Klebsormidium nitens TaxID=105231 RepID=A0A1Y1HJS4_KLENI|nr:hypothetical protein KFL_000190140 [Klebsormidium nitens]|eukprot:GAQ78795.1 hypothetical protein KFL_000190140 [Klebsormidium nitens]